MLVLLFMLFSYSFRSQFSVVGGILFTFPPGWPPAPSPAGGRKRVETGNTSRERLHSHPRPSPPEPQLIPILMSDGEDDDDQPPQGERQRQRSRSRERVYPHVPVPQEAQIQPMVTPESDDEISDVDFAIVDFPPSAEQGIALEEPKDPDRVSEYIHVHTNMLVNNNSLLYLPPPPGIQQNQTTQSDDEKSAIVDPQNRVSNHSGPPQGQEDTRRQGPQTPKGKNILPKSCRVHRKKAKK